jgi:hypothetical protein
MLATRDLKDILFAHLIHNFELIEISTVNRIDAIEEIFGVVSMP